LPMGKILRGFFDRNVKVGISSRALGSVRHTGEGDIVQDDLHFICWDFVSEPSTHGAWMMKESVDVDPSVLRDILSRSDRVFRSANEIIQIHRLIRDKKQ